jgi:hypothetical protein
MGSCLFTKLLDNDGMELPSIYHDNAVLCELFSRATFQRDSICEQATVVAILKGFIQTDQMPESLCEKISPEYEHDHLEAATMPMLKFIESIATTAFAIRVQKCETSIYKIGPAILMWMIYLFSDNAGILKMHVEQVLRKINPDQENCSDRVEELFDICKRTILDFLEGLVLQIVDLDGNPVSIDRIRDAITTDGEDLPFSADQFIDLYERQLDASHAATAFEDIDVATTAEDMPITITEMSEKDRNILLLCSTSTFLMLEMCTSCPLRMCISPFDELYRHFETTAFSSVNCLRLMEDFCQNERPLL